MLNPSYLDMKYNIRFALIIFLFNFINVAYAQQFKKDLATDLKFYKDSLPVKHKNLFAKLSRTDFDLMTNQLAEQIPILSIEKFYIGLMKIQAAVGDEHSTIIPPYTTKYPIKLERFDDGLVVVATDEANKQLLLTKVIGIGGHSLTEAEKTVSTVIIAGNTPYFHIAEASYLASPGLLYGLNLSPSPDYVDLRLLNPKGDTLKVRLNAIPKTQPTALQSAPVYNGLMANRSKENYWYTMEQANLYFNYAKCQDDPKKPFDQFNDQLFKEIEKQQPKKIIIDLRMNGGGNSAILEPFIERIRKSSLNKKGKIYVLIGRATFSSALMNAIKLQQETQAILVGETTAGTINHYGEVRDFKLPGTRVQINYSTQYWENWKGHDGPLVPEIKIAKKLADLLDGNDKVLNYVISN